MAIVEIYECDECGSRSSHGPDDGLEDGWQENNDGDTFCALCLKRRPLDAHECDDDMCCYGRTAGWSRTDVVIVSHPSGEQREGGE